MEANGVTECSFIVKEAQSLGIIDPAKLVVSGEVCAQQKLFELVEADSLRVRTRSEAASRVNLVPWEGFLESVGVELEISGVRCRALILYTEREAIVVLICNHLVVAEQVLQARLKVVERPYGSACFLSPLWHDIDDIGRAALFVFGTA